MPPPQLPAAAQPPQLRMDTANGKFELIKDIGSGNFGVAKLMRDRQTGEMLAVKCACCMRDCMLAGAQARVLSTANYRAVKSPLNRCMSAKSSCKGNILMQAFVQAPFKGRMDSGMSSSTNGL